MKKPIETIVDALAGRVRVEPSGEKSLAHLLVVVPTAQSGRRLRQKLAERLGALVPPLVKTPRGMMLDEDDPALAGRTDELLAFAEALAEEGRRKKEERRKREVGRKRGEARRSGLGLRGSCRTCGWCCRPRRFPSPTSPRT